MEEKKTAKEVSIDEGAKVSPEQKKQRKATYEELNNYCIQLFNQNKQLLGQLRQREMSNLFKRLDYLFRVIGHKDSFSPDFVGDCTAEIENALALSSEGQSPKEEENKEDA